MRDDHQEAAGLWESCGPQSEGHAVSSWGHRPDRGAQSSQTQAQFLLPRSRADTDLPLNYTLADLPLADAQTG